MWVVKVSTWLIVILLHKKKRMNGIYSCTKAQTCFAVESKECFDVAEHCVFTSLKNLFCDILHPSLISYITGAYSTLWLFPLLVSIGPSL